MGFVDTLDWLGFGAYSELGLVHICTGFIFIFALWKDWQDTVIITPCISFSLSLSLADPFHSLRICCYPLLGEGCVNLSSLLLSSPFYCTITTRPFPSSLSFSLCLSFFHFLSCIYSDPWLATFQLLIADHSFLPSNPPSPTPRVRVK